MEQSVIDQPENGQYSATKDLFEGYHEYKLLEFMHNAAIKMLRMRFDILNDEFHVKYERNPIHHVESRLKSPQSMARKLEKKGLPVSIQSARQNLNDIAGVRVVCSYIDDVYAVADMLLRQNDIRLIKWKDYIKEPNFNGYRSLHLDIAVPINLSDRTEQINVEVQIRSVAMDFWASLEHDLRYKTDKVIPDAIGEQMVDVAERIASIDLEMQKIYREIQNL